MPAFEVTCNGGTSTCACAGNCTGVGEFNAAALHTIVFGRGSSSCVDAVNSYYVGMCDIFSRITPANVVITYAQTGMGFAGRPGGPVPTITISLQNLPFQFFFVGGFLGLDHMQMPGLTTSITAEDLSSGGAS
jgi:hypothetical protein